MKNLSGRKNLFVLMLIALTAGRAWAQTELIIQRAESRINAGFRERVYIDGQEVLVLRNGESGAVRIQGGEHSIHAELYSLTTPRLSFSAGSSGTLRFVITPYSLNNFVVEQQGPGVSRTQAPSAGSNSVEGSLERAADRIMERIASHSRVAIVYVSAEDRDIAEYIAGELEFIMVQQGLIVIDRSELDRVRREQRFQASGEVDDTQAVSIGRFAGASVIITGAVTGRGDLRRLRLRALDTQTAQVLSAASERY
jgi:hypothetical protein